MQSVHLVRLISHLVCLSKLTHDRFPFWRENAMYEFHTNAGVPKKDIPTKKRSDSPRIRLSRKIKYSTKGDIVEVQLVEDRLQNYISIYKFKKSLLLLRCGKIFINPVTKSIYLFAFSRLDLDFLDV